jgi:methylaspartate mutase epsilon subunit
MELRHRPQGLSLLAPKARAKAAPQAPSTPEPRAEQPLGHSVLLGGLGGDSHSVGLHILRQALMARGYDVLYIGTQNPLETFWTYAPAVNLVMVSCMDGHARSYLRSFPEQRLAHAGEAQPLWFLGGNPAVEDLVGGERLFRAMGFSEVFLGFVGIETVLEAVARALADVEVRAVSEALKAHAAKRSPHLPAWLSDERLAEADLLSERRQVLQHWPTGAGAQDLQANAAFLRRVPNWTERQAATDAAGTGPLVQPRAGVPGEREQLAILQAYRRSGADVLSYQVDSYTRNNNYPFAEEAMRESARSGYATMNGFPVVNHGVAPLRRIASALKAPLQTRHSTRDPRLLCEVSLAGGVTAYEGGPICYNLPYYRDYPLADSITAWRYVDRLCGLYAEKHGIVVDREYFGTLTATLIPPCLAIATGILEAVLAAQQGVQAVSLGWAEQGCRFQDIAAVRSIRPLAREVLGNFGFGHVQVSAVYHQYMAAFPGLATQAEELIHQSAVTAKLSGATRMMTKTAVEAFKIPSMADNIAGLTASRRGIAEAAEVSVDQAAVQREMAQIRRETLALVEATIALGKGNLAAGIVEAFRRGVLDVPFAPSIHNRGLAACARGADKAVRFLEVGRLPFDAETKTFHREAMQQRRRLAGVRPDQGYLLIEQDILQVAKGQYERWPLAS